ncbi:MAG: ATP-binding protein [Candidatus Micrarchaeota archaeon]
MSSSDVFEEWNAYAKKKELLPREVDFDSVLSNAEFKLVAVTGIRRCGKSSLLMLLAQKIEKEGGKVGYINIEDSRLKGDKNLLDNVLKWFGDGGFLLLDEITNASDWQGWLARTHELLKGKIRLIVSSSRKSLVLPNRPLRGRILAFELYPLSFKEFLKFKGIVIEKTTVGRGRVEKAFLEYLKYGGFPEVALVKEEIDKVRILGAYFKDIVGLDVAEISGQDINVVETFGKYVIQSPYFSASKCLNFFKTLGYKIGKEKILQLEKYSQACYLFFFVPIFSYGIKDKSQYPRKTYCGDNGFSYGVTGKMDFGRLFENVTFLELKRRTQGQEEICYWKNKQGLEVDFVIKRGNDVSEIMQVVYEFNDEKTRKREINAIVECARELNPAKVTILTRDTAETKTFDGVEIRFVPLMDWLLE